jgi:hypothetical protein
VKNAGDRIQETEGRNNGILEGWNNAKKTERDHERRKAV